MALHLKSTGIDFADFGHGTGTMTGELLDDYEEGSWLGYWTDGTNDASNTIQQYTRVGALCQIDFNQAEDWDAHSCTGTATIKGLPFNALQQGAANCLQHRYVTIPATGAHLVVHHGGGVDTVVPYWVRNGDSNLAFTFEHMASWGAFDHYFGMSYITV